MGKKGSKSSSSSPKKKGKPPISSEAAKKKGRPAISSPEAPKEPMFTFFCMNREHVRVDVRCFYQFDMLWDCLDWIDEMRREGMTDVLRFQDDVRDITWPNHVDIPKNILLLVVDYCVKRFEIMKAYKYDDDLDSLSHKLKEFDSEFLRRKQSNLLLQIFDAATILGIKTLLILVLNAIADRIPNIVNHKNSIKGYPTWPLDVICDESDDELEMSDGSSNSD